MTRAARSVRPPSFTMGPQAALNSGGLASRALDPGALRAPTPAPRDDHALASGVRDRALPARALGELQHARERAESEELVGAIVAGLCVERVVAEGGVGVVYEARPRGGGEAVAIKVLKARHAGDRGLVSRFEREIRYARRVRHPNVASALHAGHLADGRPYFVMDLLAGRTLGAAVRAGGPLSISRAVAVGDQILAGLAAIHAARIVHRDLQPDNVFLVERRGAAFARIIDFGFSHEPGADTGDGVTADSSGALVGTPRFMSPEQATRARAITARSDLFAAALLIHYAASGKLPFRGEGDRDVLVSILRKAPIPLRRSVRSAPAELDAVLRRALSKHPDARFADASEMRAALAEVPA